MPPPLSHPPLLHRNQWKGAGLERQFPGGNHTFMQSIAARPLAHAPDENTVRELQAATGGAFNTLQQTIQLPAEMLRATSMTSPPVIPAAPPGGRSGGSKMPIYDSIWPNTTAPTFSNWDYCQKRGHAPPPNSLPAPRVTDMKSWFATYGQPQKQPPPGFRTEFSSLGKSVRHSDSELSAASKMFPGRVLK